MSSHLRIWVFLSVLLFFKVAVAGQVVSTSPHSRAITRTMSLQLEKTLSVNNLRLGAPIFVRIFKQSSELELWVESDDRQFHLFRSYKICDFSGGLGPKLHEGDGKSPEGFYYINPSQMNPFSSFNLSFNLGYPNVYDRKHKRDGSYLMVHGGCLSAGCYAMTDPVIEEIYTLAEAALIGGQPFFRVHIFPFRMTDANLSTYGEQPWVEFWKNLKEGYDFFELRRRPPNVTVQDGSYAFALEPE